MSALKGITVLELGTSVAVEYCGKLLSDFGAQVIKLENPVTGSPTRYLMPLKDSPSSQETDGDNQASLLFAYLNTNKLSITLDIESSTDVDIFNQLLENVDAIIDDQSSQWLAKVGLTPDKFEKALPGTVLCTVTPFGLDASNDQANWCDLHVFHASGWGFHTPSAADPTKPPLKGPGRFLVSYEAGLDAALCLSAALYERMESKTGQVIDISAQAVMASRMDYVLGQMIAGDMNVSNDRHALDLAGPADIYPCADGYIYIWMSAPSHWQALAELMGNPSWMRDFPENWLERECTPARVEQCRNYLAPWLAQQPKVQFAKRAQAKGLIVVPVNTAHDLCECEQYQHRGYFKSVTHPSLGDMKYPSVPYRMSKTPVSIQTPAPTLGQHNQRVLNELITQEADHANG